MVFVGCIYWIIFFNWFGVSEKCVGSGKKKIVYIKDEKRINYCRFIKENV